MNLCDDGDNTDDLLLAAIGVADETGNAFVRLMVHYKRVPAAELWVFLPIWFVPTY